MSVPLIVGNLVFGGIGFVAFVYGKRMQRTQVMALGGVLMVYGYFVTNTALLYAAGAVLTGMLWWARD